MPSSASSSKHVLRIDGFRHVEAAIRDIRSNPRYTYPYTSLHLYSHTQEDFNNWPLYISKELRPALPHLKRARLTVIDHDISLYPRLKDSGRYGIVRQLDLRKVFFQRASDLVFMLADSFPALTSLTLSDVWFRLRDAVSSRSVEADQPRIRNLNISHADSEITNFLARSTIVRKLKRLTFHLNDYNGEGLTYFLWHCGAPVGYLTIRLPEILAGLPDCFPQEALDKTRSIHTISITGIPYASYLKPICWMLFRYRLLSTSTSNPGYSWPLRKLELELELNCAPKRLHEHPDPGFIVLDSLLSQKQFTDLMPELEVDVIYTVEDPSIGFIDSWHLSNAYRRFRRHCLPETYGLGLGSPMLSMSVAFLDNSEEDSDSEGPIRTELKRFP